MRIRCPVAFVLATKRHQGTTEEPNRTTRAGIFPSVESKPNGRILAKHPDTAS